MELDRIMEQLKFHSTKYIYWIERLNEKLQELNINTNPDNKKSIRMDDTIGPPENINKPKIKPTQFI
jgi:hypothetical protein